MTIDSKGGTPAGGGAATPDGLREVAQRVVAAWGDMSGLPSAFWLALDALRTALSADPGGARTEVSPTEPEQNHKAIVGVLWRALEEIEDACWRVHEGEHAARDSIDWITTHVEKVRADAENAAARPREALPVVVAEDER